jgi:hypothetical protein
MLTGWASKHLSGHESKDGIHRIEDMLATALPELAG